MRCSSTLGTLISGPSAIGQTTQNLPACGIFFSHIFHIVYQALDAVPLQRQRHKCNIPEQSVYLAAALVPTCSQYVAQCASCFLRAGAAQHGMSFLWLTWPNFQPANSARFMIGWWGTLRCLMGTTRFCRKIVNIYSFIHCSRTLQSLSGCMGRGVGCLGCM